MKLEVILILEDTEIYHRSVSMLNDDINPYTGAINALVNELTTGKGKQTVPVGKMRQANTDKFTDAVPDYKEITKDQIKESMRLEAAKVDSKTEQFHPDLVKAGIAPKQTNAIPVVKLDMKTIFAEKK